MGGSVDERKNSRQHLDKIAARTDACLTFLNDWYVWQTKKCLIINITVNGVTECLYVLVATRWSNIAEMPREIV